MKGLDTPVLLEILHDTPASRRLLKTLRGEELATTELNMAELCQIASHGPRSTRSARLKSLVGLRRRITVVPITNAAADELVREAGAHPIPNGTGPLIWSALSAAGCGEWFTTRAAAPSRASTKLKVRIL
jgi:hypothetical protein